MTGPNPQVIAIAQLAQHLATTVANTLEHIRHELATNNGLKAATIDGFGSRTADTTTTVEHAANIRIDLTNHRTQIYDDIRTLALIIYSCQDTCRKAAGTRIPTEPPRCTANPDHDGYTLPLDEGGWHDPLCQAIPRSTRGGLCDACRKRLERYRERMNLKPINDERPVQHDTDTVIGDDGVAHTRPTRGAA